MNVKPVSLNDCLVSLFNSISIFMGYLMSESSLEDSSGTI